MTRGGKRWRGAVGLAVAAVVAIGVLHALAQHGEGVKLPRWLTSPRSLSAAPLPAAFGPVRAVPPALLGFNGEALTDNVWSDPRFVRAVAALHPQVIRVFGGTTANYWNWRTGTFVHSPGVPQGMSAARPHLRVTLADWARLVRAAHATPDFVLNMLTSNLRDQLAMLRAARALGMPVAEVELGNELYLPKYARAFPDGAGYGRVASRWIASIKRAFPGVSVAADAYPGADTNTATVSPRERRWNSGLLRTLRGESALSVHSYFASGLGPRASLASPAVAEAMLRAPERRFGTLAELVARLPRRVQIWVTEWNLFDTVARVHGTWAQGLAVAAYGLELVSSPRVDQADYHALVNNAAFDALFGSSTELAPPARRAATAFRPVGADPPPTPVFGLAAGGVAMQALLGGLAGEHAVRPVRFGSVPVGGVAFGGGPRPGAVIVNLTRDLVPISLPAGLRGRPYVERWAPPITLVAGVASLQARTGSTSERIDLEPFSLLWIK